MTPALEPRRRMNVHPDPRQAAAEAPPDAGTIRLRPLWYAPIFCGSCWFAFIVIELSRPPAGSGAVGAGAILIGGLLPFLWHIHAARSPGTFLELSRRGIRRSVYGRGWFYRWDSVEAFKIHSRIRGPRWAEAVLRDDPAAHRSRKTVRIDGHWTLFLFGGLTNDGLVDGLNAWRQWAISGRTTPPPSLVPQPNELVEMWAGVQIGIGCLVCLVSGWAFAFGPGGFVNIIGSVLGFALATLTIAALVALSVGARRIGKHPVAWQLAWIAFALATSWAGHLAIGLFPSFRAIPPLIYN